MSTTGSVASSLEGLAEQYRTITENLANANTAGYKAKRVSFEQTLAEAVGGDAGTGGSKVSAAPATNFAQGPLTPTEGPLDVGIHGKGFFQMQTPNGPVYTRSGRFRLNERRELVDAAGGLVAGTGGQIVLPSGTTTAELRVTREGDLRIGAQTIGTLKVVDFEDSSALTRQKNGTFKAPAGLEPTDSKDFAIHQGFVEASNVSVVEELVGLITVSRLYEANLRSISVMDEQMKNILQVAMS